MPIPMTDNSIPDNFGDDLFFDDSGSLQFREGDEETPDETVVTDTPEPKPAPEAPNFDSRVSAMEETINKLTAVVGALAQTTQNQNFKNLETQEPELDLGDDDGYMNPKQLAKVISDNVKLQVQKAMQEQMNPYTTSMEQAKLQAEYNSALAKHGDPFQKALPSVIELMKVDSRLDFETAYSAYRAMMSVQKIEPSKNENGNIQARKPVDRAAIEEKANRLNLPTNNAVSGDATGKPKISTVDDALQAAIDELLG